MEAAATPLQRSGKCRLSAHISSSLKDFENRARVEWKTIKIKHWTSDHVTKYADNSQETLRINFTSLCRVRQWLLES
jgi:hypothetical protein